MRNFLSPPATLVALLLVLLAGLHQPAKAQQALDADNGFMGIQLGAERDSALTTKVRLRGKFQKLIRWDVLSEHLSYEGIELYQVRLFFWDSKLHSIEVKAQGAQGDALRNWVLDRYGEGDKKDAMGFNYQWDAKNLQLFFDQNLITKDLKLTFRDREVHKLYYKFRYIKAYGK